MNPATSGAIFSSFPAACALFSKPPPPINQVQPPPRFLLGAALVFWGGITDRPLIGILLALLFETAHWVRLRWNFNESAYIRAWQISMLSCGLMAVFIWLDGDLYNALPRLLGWLPAIFLPVQFTQSFGLRDAIPVSTFSFFARQRQLRNERLGLQGSTVKLNFGNAYLIACMVASVLGEYSDTVFFLIGLILLSGWAILASRKGRWGPLAAALGIASGLAVAGQFGLTYLERALVEGHGGSDGKSRSDVIQTAIGALGEIKLSPEIKWRLTPLDGTAPPKLIRTAAYNKYNAGKWRNAPGAGANDLDFVDLKTQLVNNEAFYFLRIDADETAARAELPHFKLRGAATSNSQLPLPGDAASVRDFELDSIERNTLGTVRIFPKNSVIDGTVLWKNGPTAEEAPDNTWDLHIPKPEEATLQAVAKELGLADEPTVEGKIQLISRWFFENFRYTRYATIAPTRGEPDSATAISIFLTRDRKGHCEYFATAAALLLREAGVPTRYNVGFAVMERDLKRGEFVIRGTHGHAWCRVWNAAANAWIDFDATPPGWLALERPPDESKTQWLADSFLRVREDFFLWRNRPRNRIGASVVMIAIGVIALAIIGRRLWRSKHVVPASRKSSYGGPVSRTPLHDLESFAKTRLGPRPPGLPFSRWLLGLRHSLAKPEQLDEAIALHQRLRFDPAPPEAPPIERLQKLVDAIRAEARPK